MKKEKSRVYELDFGTSRYLQNCPRHHLLPCRNAVASPSRRRQHHASPRRTFSSPLNHPTKPSSFSPLRFAYSRAEPLLPLPRLVARRRHGRRAQLAADLRLRPISSKSARPASFSTFHRCFPTHPSPPPRAGTPPSVSRAAAAHRPPSSSHLRFPLAPTDRGNGFTSPQRSSPARLPPSRPTGAPPPRSRPAAASAPPRARRRRPPQPQSRVPRGAAQSPLPFPQLFPHRRSLSSPENGRPTLLCSPMSARDPR